MNEQDFQALLQNPKLNDIKDLLTALESSGVKPKELINLINKKDNIQNSIDEIENIKNTWCSMQETITKLDVAIKNIEDNKDRIEELKDFHQEALVGNEKQKSIKDSIKDILSEIVEIKKDYKEVCDEYENNFKDLYEKNEKKINLLLGNVTEASLSVGYKEKREEINKSKKWWGWIFVLSNIIFIIIFALYFGYIFNEEFQFIHLIRGLPMFFFCGFFCFYSTKQIEKYSRLEQEYAYKESLSKTYVGYNKQIEDLADKDDGNLKIKLLDIMLQSAGFNPSVTLEKNHGTKFADMLKKDNEDKK